MLAQPLGCCPDLHCNRGLPASHHQVRVWDIGGLRKKTVAPGGGGGAADDMLRLPQVGGDWEPAPGGQAAAKGLLSACPMPCNAHKSFAPVGDAAHPPSPPLQHLLALPPDPQITMLIPVSGHNHSLNFPPALNASRPAPQMNADLFGGGDAVVKYVLEVRPKQCCSQHCCISECC